MKDIETVSLERRQWFGQMSLPLLGMSLRESPLAPSHQSTQGRAQSRDLGARVYNVREFGARGDGTTLDTNAVQAAIDACTRDNGGKVLIPAGTFVVGTIELKSNVTLYLAAQGRLLGSATPAHYRAGNEIPPSNGNIVLLSAAHAENVTIEGPGTIDGNGLKFFTGRGDNTGPGQNSAQGYFQRPHLMVFYQCRNLRIRDVFLTASAYHCVRILQCRRVNLDGIRIYNRVNLNNDGFHINGSQHVHITNCDVVCQDDACALFGSNKFVTVTNCTFSTRWSVFRFGGGEAENIAISNCVIYETYGCPIKMRCGARSRFENITFANLVMKDVTGPISIGLDSSRGSSGTTPPVRGVVRNISFHGIRASVVARGRQHEDLAWQQNFRPGETRSCIVVNGVRDEFLEGISFHDVHIVFEGGGSVAEAEREVPQMAGEYFEIGTPPAYGLYARNVRGLTLHDVRLETRTSDVRPAVVFDQVEDASINGLTATGNLQATASLRFINTREALLSAARLLTPAAAFLRLEGESCDSITIDGGSLKKALQPVVLERGASANAVKLRT